jgi:hypothetical protein
MVFLGHPVPRPNLKYPVWQPSANPISLPCVGAKENSAPPLSRFHSPPAADPTAPTLSGLRRGVLTPRWKPPISRWSLTKSRHADRPCPPLPDLAPPHQLPPKSSWSTVLGSCPPQQQADAPRTTHRRDRSCCSRSRYC